MSLYVGHLSPRTRREDLERVFRRFGRCNVQLKDGYGFVVYEVNANAERALRSMRGKIVCGEHITLSWSNKQPRPFPKFYRPARVHESFGGRDFKDDSRFLRNVNREAQRTEDELEKTADGSPGAEEVRAERETSFKEKIDEGGGGGEQDLVENGRWGEELVDVVNEEGTDNGADFDRYEPYHGHRGREFSSSDRERSTEKVDINHDKSKTQLTCYRCGLVGHIKRNCPEGDSRRDQFGKNFRRRDDNHSRAWTDGRLKRPRSASGRREPGKFRRAISSSPSPSERKVKQRHKIREESEKSQHKQKVGTAVRRQKKKRARSGTSSLLSNSSTSSSHSRSISSRSRSRTRSRSGSGSRSASSRSNSVSSSSKSAAIGSSSKSAGSRLRSSSPLSRSLSVSLDRKLPSAPEKALVNDHRNESSEGFFEHVANKSEKLLVANLGTSEPKDVLDDKDASLAMRVDDGTGDESLLINGDGAEDSSFQIRGKETSLCHGDGVPVGPFVSNLQFESRSNNSTTSKMTTQEVVMVLRHYGLPVPTDVEPGISVEEYFGAARLWPWELIYYRRLKRGPITIENYARRVEQNKEFGIVDKFIRSSSGWGTDY